MVRRAARGETSPQMRAHIFGRVVAAMKIGIDIQVARSHFNLDQSRVFSEQLRSLVFANKMKLKESAIRDAGRQFRKLIKKEKSRGAKL